MVFTAKKLVMLQEVYKDVGLPTDVYMHYHYTNKVR